MRYNPIVTKQLDTIKDEQFRKDCMAVFYALSIGASSKLLFEAKEELKKLNTMGFVDTTTDPISISIPMFIKVPKKNEELHEPTAVEKSIEDHIEAYRQLFRGYRVGSMGDKEACSVKMNRWLSTNPKYSMEDVMKAAEYYIANLNDPSYITQADYFIYKQNSRGEEISKLSSILDEVDLKTVGSSPWETTL